MNPVNDSDLNPEVSKVLQNRGNLAPPEQGQFRIHDTLREVHRIANLDQVTFQNELPLIHALFSNFTGEREQINETALRDLVSLRVKVQQWAGNEERLLQKIETITSPLQASHPSREKFWKDISLKLDQNPQLTDIEVPGYGTFERSFLENLTRLEIHPDPQNLSALAAKKLSFLQNYENKEEIPALHRHIIEGRDEQIAEDLKGSDISKLDSNEKSALVWAIILGDANRVKQLLQAGAQQEGLLHEVVTRDKLEILTVLHALGSDMNQVDNTGATALHDAVACSNIKMVLKLIELGAEVKSSSNDGTTPLHQAGYAGHLSSVKTLLKHGAEIDREDKKGMTPLMAAAQNGNIDVVKELLAQGADYNKADSMGATALSIAAENKRMDIVHDILEYAAKSAAFDQPDANGLTPLMLAIQYRQTDIAKELIAKGADCFKTNANSATAIFQAAESEQMDIVHEMLVDVAKSADFDKAGITGLTPLMLAIAYQQTDIAKELIVKGADFNKADASGQTPLMFALLYQQTDIAKDLLARGADFQKADANGQNPLMLAAKNNQFDIVHVILTSVVKGVDFDKADGNGQTPLMLALISGQLEIAKELLAKGADYNHADANGKTPLMLAAASGYEEIVKELLTKGTKFDSVDANNQSALMLAAKSGNTNIAKMLLTKGADPNQKDKNGHDALYFATSNGDLSLFEALIASKADVDSVYSEGRTTLYRLKTGRPPGYKQMRQLVKVGAAAPTKTFSRAYSRIKILAHSFAFKGSSSIQGREIEWEAGQSAYAVTQMARSIPKFAEATSLIDKTTANRLSEILQHASDQESHTASQLLERCNKGEPTWIRTGFDGHASTVLIWNDLFVLCDKGGDSPAPLQIHRFDRSKLDRESIQLLFDVRSMSPEQYKKATLETLPKKLAFTKSQNEIDLEILIQLAFQIVGNCSWASNEGMLHVFLILDKLKSKAFKLEGISAEDLKKTTDNTFTTWLAFQQMLLLDKYISADSDHALMLKCFEALWSLTPAQPTTLEKLKTQLEALENKYLQIASPMDSVSFLITKARYRALPKDPLLDIKMQLGKMDALILQLQQDMKETAHLFKRDLTP